jgi:hypothetical protein
LGQRGEQHREKRMKRTVSKKSGSAPKPQNQPDPKVHRLDSTNPKLKYIGGSSFDAWNNIIASQATNSIWHGHNPDAERSHERQVASLSMPAGISPSDEFEGMLAAQLLASHNAAMECYRRAMIAEQSFEGRKENLNQANKLSRTHATLLEALNRHRGKGQQKVTVEHVHVHNGGQAIVGNVQGGCSRNWRINPMLLDMHRAKRCGARTRSGKPCQSPAVRTVPLITRSSYGQVYPLRGGNELSESRATVWGCAILGYFIPAWRMVACEIFTSG